MSSVVYLPIGLDVAALRWPPRCVCCGGERQTETVAKIADIDNQSATIRIPYCARHSQEATRNRTIIHAASLSGPLLGLMVLLAGIAGLVLSWPLTAFERTTFIEYVESMLGYAEAALGLLLLSLFIAIKLPDLALTALSRFIPSLSQSQKYRFLGVDYVPTRLLFANDEVAADFKELNYHLALAEPRALPVHRRLERVRSRLERACRGLAQHGGEERVHPEPSLNGLRPTDAHKAPTLPVKLLGGASVALLIVLLLFLVMVFLAGQFYVQPR